MKYRGPVDLANFDCTAELDGSVVKRVCYNAEHSYMLIRLKQVWYHYCEIDQGTVSALLAAGSKGAFYNKNIKDAATGAASSVAGISQFRNSNPLALAKPPFGIACSAGFVNDAVVFPANEDEHKAAEKRNGGNGDQSESPPFGHFEIPSPRKCL
ncbi:KTSC domain-containing protein [Mesorhizobium sp. B2-3-14]|uniref:KTSC domain-containing protein n=1 Tax=Mesorhizobium sp. B2-3-14 TaxID=2589950 RepID=UPI001AED1323|nr:KTSC domain-containing protein [Mesorhizobium sp. B2-3-14]